MNHSVAVRSLGTSIGAEVSGMDISKPLTDEAIGWIGSVLAQHAVLVLRDQKLDAAQLGTFGRRFGTPRPHFLEGFQHPEFPEVSLVTNVAPDGSIDAFGVKRATVWHSDETYNEVPPRLAILHGLEVPAQGGGTIFADMRAAFDSLPDPMKDRLRQLTGLHRFGAGPADARTTYAGRLGKEQQTDRPHPAVVRHPDSDREILFVNPAHTFGFAEMGREEGFEMVRELADKSVQEPFIYHHHWRVGDVVMWDEVATMHKGAGDYAPNERRVLLRTIVHPPIDSVSWPVASAHHSGGEFPPDVSEVELLDLATEPSATVGVAALLPLR